MRAHDIPCRAALRKVACMNVIAADLVDARPQRCPSGRSTGPSRDGIKPSLTGYPEDVSLFPSSSFAQPLSSSMPPHPSTLDHSDDAEKGLAPATTEVAFLTAAVLPIVPLSKTKTDLATAQTAPLKVSLAAPAMPKSTVPPESRWLLFSLWFNTYRKFFIATVTLNLVGIILAITGKWTYPHHYTGAFVLGNLFVAVLMRNELFGRFLYLIVNTLFAKWTPLWWRLTCTSVLQHIGGIHSGCAISGFCWLILRVAFIFIDNKPDFSGYGPVLAFGVVTNVAVMISVISAFPWVRNTHHNIFERHHRFIGWIGLLSTWGFVVLGDSYDRDTHTWSASGYYLSHQQDFWFATGMTIFIAIPWVTVRRVKVDVEIPSPKVAILRFDRGMQQGLLGRISRSSVLEYHAFGIISEGKNAKCHYMICGVQGDFTRSLVQTPPEYVWTRELKFAGVSNTSTLYKRGIRVCTGTGIGAALSTCLQSKDWFLIWIGSDQERTFGSTVSGLIHRNIGPERMILWDSKKEGGRPDTMKLVKEAYASWGAEVVFITSNYQGNSEMMKGCRAAGIPAFGTLWDF